MKNNKNCTYVEEARQCIDARLLVEALERHALGEIKMTSTQVSAALALLKKVMPDISTSKVDKNKNQTLSHEEALKKLE